MDKIKENIIIEETNIFEIENLFFEDINEWYKFCDDMEN